MAPLATGAIACPAGSTVPHPEGTCNGQRQSQELVEAFLDVMTTRAQVPSTPCPRLRYARLVIDRLARNSLTSPACMRGVYGTALLRRSFCPLLYQMLEQISRAGWSRSHRQHQCWPQPAALARAGCFSGLRTAVKRRFSSEGWPDGCGWRRPAAELDVSSVAG